MSEPRYAADYSARQTEAVRRVLVDVQQVLAGFKDRIVPLLCGGPMSHAYRRTMASQSSVESHDLSRLRQCALLNRASPAARWRYA